MEPAMIGKIEPAAEGELDTLLREHEKDILALQERLKDVLESSYDNVWLLRYLLSNNSIDESEESCRYTIQWRKERREKIGRVHAGERPDLYEQVKKFQVADDHKFTTKGEPLFIVRIGLCNPRALMDALPFDDLLEFYLLCRERAFVYCDKLTREQRILVKMVIVLDFNGFSITRGVDTRFGKLNGATSKLSEKMYPQLLGRTVLIGTPSVFPWLFKFMRPLMSERTVAKMVFCPGPSDKKDLTACPYSRQYLGAESLPTFLGGTCCCNDGCCISGVPNSQTTPNNSVDAQGLASVSISPRSLQSIQYPVAKGMKVDFLFQAEGKPVSVIAEIVNAESASKTMLLEKHTLQAADGIIAGQWDVPFDGMLTITMRNCHAIFRARSVKFKVEIVN